MQTKEFTLGDFKYTAPTIIGGGSRMLYQEYLSKRMRASEKFDQIIDDIKIKYSIKTAPVFGDPNAEIIKLKERKDKEKIFKEYFSECLSEFAQTSPYETSLFIMELILTPCEGSPSVKVAFDSYCSDEEAVNVVNFFTNLFIGKTKKEDNNTPSSKITKGKKTKEKVLETTSHQNIPTEAD